jgi:hypothetical protein
MPPSINGKLHLKYILCFLASSTCEFPNRVTHFFRAFVVGAHSVICKRKWSLEQRLTISMGPCYTSFPEMCFVLLIIPLGQRTGVQRSQITSQTPQAWPTLMLFITPKDRKYQKYFQTFRKIGRLDITSQKNWIIKASEIFQRYFRSKFDCFVHSTTVFFLTSY